MTGYLVLEDGTVFGGRSVAADGRAFGEAVFTTSMSGYQETVTDPSYAGQIVCFTAPMVGNYGVAHERSQSGAVHATAVVMSEVGGSEWTDWLRGRGVVAVAGVDTRSLVLHLRVRGAMRAAVVAGDPPVDEVLAEADTEHRGANHPVVDHATRRVLVTSQNHGFAVAPGGGEGVTHTSLYDGTVEGLNYPELRARSAQFHPEASPGPHDGAPIIAEWVEELRAVA